MDETQTNSPKDDKEMIKSLVVIKRPNGNIEEVDLSSKIYAVCTKQLVQTIREQNTKAGRGEVIKVVQTFEQNNHADLWKHYNDLHNEGGEGYVPESFVDHPNYRTWTKTVEVF